MKNYRRSDEKPARLPSGIVLAYDTFGDPSSDPILLIQGLSWSMILWDEDFCSRLADRGYFVIRFDNRDIGHSTKLESLGTPNIRELIRNVMEGKPVSAPYLLSDMAGDAFGLLDHLEIESAHVAGISMGGMIGQTMAIERPERVRSLASLCSTTGHPSLPQPTPEAMKVITVPPPSDREGFIAHFMQNWRILSGSRFPVDEKRVRVYAEQSFGRGFSTPGVARQIAAVNASGSRREALQSLKIPVLVIHGGADPLLPLECGIDTAEAVPGARMKIIEGMGHTLPEPVWDEIIDAIADLGLSWKQGGDQPIENVENKMNYRCQNTHKQ